jgi:hypothetical protein
MFCIFKIKKAHGPWEVQIIHVYQKVSKCVDMLANMGNEGISNSVIVFFENPL